MAIDHIYGHKSGRFHQAAAALGWRCDMQMASSSIARSEDGATYRSGGWTNFSGHVQYQKAERHHSVTSAAWRAQGVGLKAWRKPAGAENISQQYQTTIGLGRKEERNRYLAGGVIYETLVISVIKKKKASAGSLAIGVVASKAQYRKA